MAEQVRNGPMCGAGSYSDPGCQSERLQTENRQLSESLREVRLVLHGVREWIHDTYCPDDEFTGDCIPRCKELSENLEDPVTDGKETHDLPAHD